MTKKFNNLFLNELSSEIEEFSTFIGTFNSMDVKTEVLDDLYIILHTLKGNTSAFRNNIKEESKLLTLIDSFVDFIHKTEDFIEISKSIPSFTKEFKSLLYDINTFLNLFLLNIQNHFNETVFIIPDTSHLLSQISNFKTGTFKENEHKKTFSLSLSTPEELKHPYLAIAYRDIEEVFNVTECAPTQDDLSNGNDFTSIIVTINSDLSNDEIISTLKSIDNISTADLLIPPINNNNQSVDEIQPSDNLVTNTNILKIEIPRIDKVLKHTSQLVILKNKLNEFLAENNFLSGTPKRKELESIFEDLTSHVEFLQESVLEIRMTPFEQLFNRFPTDVHRIAFEFDKEIAFVTSGQRTEIDKNILDELYEPIIHLIRNSIIHGIEDTESRKALGKNPKGTISIEAHHSKNKVKITISDDGKGIDLEEVKRKALELNLYTEEQLNSMNSTNLINLIFNQGLSTSNNVNKYSGRGVGMSAFRKKIEDLQGYYDIETKVNEGTKINIYLPLTTTIIDAIVTKTNNELYSVPLTQIEEIIKLNINNILYNNNKPYFFWRNIEVPLVLGHEIFSKKGSPQYSKELPQVLNIIILHSHNQILGLSFETFINQQSIVVKQIHSFLNQSKEIESYHIVSDGSISLIIDTNGLIAT